MPNDHRVDIVIPTLGEESLVDCVKSLVDSISYLGRLILVIPEERLPVNLDRCIQVWPNDALEIIRTPFASQVGQRVEGFKHSDSPFVMQLDDDTVISRTALIKLIESSIKYQASVGPRLIGKDYAGKTTGIPYRVPGRFSGLWSRITGQVLKSGSVWHGHIFGFENNRLSAEVSWLPGGCILHPRKNVVDFDYFNISGKAYFEDLIASGVLVGRNARLMRIAEVDVYTQVNYSSSCLERLWLRCHSFRARLFFLRHYKVGILEYLGYLPLFYILSRREVVNCD